MREEPRVSRLTHTAGWSASITAQTHYWYNIQDPHSGDILTSVGPIDQYGDFNVNWLKLD